MAALKNHSASIQAMSKISGANKFISVEKFEASDMARLVPALFVCQNWISAPLPFLRKFAPSWNG